MLTLVMLNWMRPACFVANVVRYASYQIVERILCFNNGPALELPAGLPGKAVLIESSSDLGLYTRFAAGALARTDAICHTDDDLIVPEHTLEALYASWLAAPLACHGLFGRAVHSGYQFGTVFGAVEVVLTRAVVCDRRVNNAALSATPRFDDLASVPVGNGEDIILSFAAMSLSGTLNAAYELDYENYPVPADAEPVAIHLRWPGHREHRERIVARCREVFSLQFPPAQPPCIELPVSRR